MTVVKVVELIGISSDNWHDAVKTAVASTSTAIDNITGVRVINTTAEVKDGKLTEFRAMVELAYEFTDSQPYP